MLTSKSKWLPLFLLFLSNHYEAEIELLGNFNILQFRYPNILEESTQKVVKITQNRTDEEVEKAEKDGKDTRNFGSIVFIGPAFEYVLGGGIQDAWSRSYKQIFSARNLITLIGGVNIGAVNSILKNRYHYPRPFVVSEEVRKATGKTYDKATAKISTVRSFPSGHVAMGYLNVLLLAQIIPERYHELMAAASDYGHSRTVLGVHYPMDVIGSRMVVMSQIGAMMSFPLFRSLVSIARWEVRRTIEFKCGASVSACIEKGISVKAADYYKIYDDEENMHNRFNQRMNYGFTKIFDSNAEFISPKNAGWLLFFRFPYLSNQQRLDIIGSTAGEAGYPLDNQTKKGSWHRVNLYEASLGPKKITGTWVVDMDGRCLEKLISGFSNPYYFFDQWSNNISGDSRLVKKGKGVLSLMGNNYLSSINVSGGGLVLNGKNNFSALSEVMGGFLQVNGEFNAPHLLVGSSGSLSGSGVINSSVDLRGTLSTSSLSPLTITKILYFYPESVYHPYVLGGTGALQAKGKAAHVILNGTLDARDMEAGSLVELKDGARLSGNFRTILQPQLEDKTIYYSVLLHGRGANLYLDSLYYPKVEGYDGNEREGATLLIRLQGTNQSKESAAYQDWLREALHTGNMKGLPQLITGQIYADTMQYLSQMSLSSSVNSAAIEDAKTADIVVEADFSVNYQSTKADKGSQDNNIRDTRFSVAFQKMATTHVSVSQQFVLNHINLKNVTSTSKVRCLSEVTGVRYYLREERQGLYLGSGVGLGWCGSATNRQLGILGKNQAKQSDYFGSLYGKLGYYAKMANGWDVEPSVMYQWQRNHYNAFVESGSNFVSKFKKRNTNSSRVKVGVELARRLVAGGDDSSWKTIPSIAFYDEVDLTRKENEVQKAYMHDLEYEIVPAKKAKYKVTLTGGLGLERKNSQIQLKANYQKVGNSHGFGAEVRFNHKF